MSGPAVHSKVCENVLLTCLFVAKELHGDDRFERLFVQLVDEGDSRWQVQLHDLFVAHFVQVLDDPPE